MASTKPLSHVKHVLLPEVSRVSKLIYFLIITYRCLYVLLQNLGIYLHEKKYFLVPLSLSVQEGISLLSIVSCKCSVCIQKGSMCLTVIFNKSFSHELKCLLQNCV